MMVMMVVVPVPAVVVVMMMAVPGPEASLDPAPAVPDRTADITNVLYQVVLRGCTQSARAGQRHGFRATAGK